MDIFGGGLVGRPAQKIGKLFDVADILVVRLGAEPADRHMSSISRRRNGLMALSVIGGSCLGCGLQPAISRQDACFCYSPRPFPCYKLPRERFSPSDPQRPFDAGDRDGRGYLKRPCGLGQELVELDEKLSSFHSHWWAKVCP